LETSAKNAQFPGPALQGVTLGACGTFLALTLGSLSVAGALSFFHVFSLFWFN
jgi:hypothetical protein